VISILLIGIFLPTHVNQVLLFSIRPIDRINEMKDVAAMNNFRIDEAQAWNIIEDTDRFINTRHTSDHFPIWCISRA
jgi:hypothetical protein